MQNATASYIVLRLTTYIFFRLRHPKYENGSCDRRISSKFGTDEGDRRNKHVVSAISMINDPDWYRKADDPSRSPRTLVARAHINTYRFLFSPTAPDVSVGNASPSPGPFSQALARALVPHLFNTSGTMRHPRNHRRRRRCRFYESLKVRQLTRAYRNASSLLLFFVFTIFINCASNEIIIKYYLKQTWSYIRS